MQNRREFLKRTMLSGAALAAAGTAKGDWWWPFGGTEGNPMRGYAAPALKRIRLGVVGTGNRGQGVIGRVLNLPGVDVASTCCLGELTEKSVSGRSRPVDIPDFTRGAWRTNRPMDVVTIDLAKFGIKA